MRKGQTLSFWWSASYVYEVKFERWVLKRESGKLVVCPLVSSNWLFNWPIVIKPQRGCRRGQAILQSHTDLYSNSKDAWKKKTDAIIKRPSVETILKLKRRYDDKRRNSK